MQIIKYNLKFLKVSPARYKLFWDIWYFRVLYLFWASCYEFKHDSHSAGNLHIIFTKSQGENQSQPIYIFGNPCTFTFRQACTVAPAPPPPPSPPTFIKSHAGRTYYKQKTFSPQGSSSSSAFPTCHRRLLEDTYFRWGTGSASPESGIHACAESTQI